MITGHFDLNVMQLLKMERRIFIQMGEVKDNLPTYEVYLMSELKPKQMFTQVQGKVKISTKSMNSNINVNGTTNSTKHVIIDKNTDFAAKVVPGGLHIM